MFAHPVRTLALTLALAGCPSAPSPTTESPGSTTAPGASGAAQPSPTDGMAGASQQGTRIHSATTSGFTGPEQLVLRDQAAWQAAWARLHEGMVAPALPTVDFTREMVVLLALGERSSGGHQVRFDGITASGADATVRYTITEPGAGCMTTQAMTAPVDIVRVPRATGTVRFEPKTERSTC
jgi:hypothetical protein